MIWFLLLLALLAAYVFWARPRLEKVSAFAAFYAKMDALYAKWFQKSRTLLTARMQIVAGYFLTAYDVIAPALNAALDSGLDLGDLVPGARWLGPGLFITGHMYSYIRRTHDEKHALDAPAVIVPAEKKEPQNVPVALLA